MKTFAFAVAGLFLVQATQAQMLVISDNYNVATSGTGFALGSGVNAGINPPLTRLTGAASSELRYIQTATGNRWRFVFCL